jgi:hypothetical protein
VYRIGLRGFIVLRLEGFFNGLCRITDPAEMTILRDTNSTKRFHSGWDICVRSTEECALPRASALLKILIFFEHFITNQRGIVTLHRNVDIVKNLLLRFAKCVKM